MLELLIVVQFAVRFCCRLAVQQVGFRNRSPPGFNRS